MGAEGPTALLGEESVGFVEGRAGSWSPVRVIRTGAFVLLTCSIACATAPAREAPASDQLAVFDDVWRAMETELYDVERTAEWITEPNRQRLRAAAARCGSRGELARDVINPFLAQLGVSHTTFFTTDDLGYYVLRSLFATRDIAQPKIAHLGVQLTSDYVVRAVFDGHPGQAAGLRRGDRLVAVDGEPYVSIRQFTGSRQRLTIERGGASIELEVEAVEESPHAGLLRAMEASVTVEARDGRRVGYVHLWSGTHPKILASFQAIVRERFADVDAIVLDLRDGFGGAWYEYIDPFYRDRSDFFSFTITGRDGKVESFSPDPHETEQPYLGPLVVLIDEGTRSGKEGLAHQFAKRGRATLVGAPTAGAFTAGKGVFADRPDADYLFYLAVAEYAVDGRRLEGHGVLPTVLVPYPLDGTIEHDPQRARAFDLAFEAVKER